MPPPPTERRASPGGASALVKILPSYDFREGDLINLEFEHCRGITCLVVERGFEADTLEAQREGKWHSALAADHCRHASNLFLSDSLGESVN